MSPQLSEQIDYLTRQVQLEQGKRKALQARLERIHQEAARELKKIEQEGGTCGFALRIRRLSAPEAQW